MSRLAEIETDYRLEEQAGFLLRVAYQRHSQIFQNLMEKDLTAAQFSVLIQLDAHGGLSQNHLGRLTAMDGATIKGVVDRLRAKGLVETGSDPSDKRRSIISLSRTGTDRIETLKRCGQVITDETLAPLSIAERAALVTLLQKIS